MNVRWKANLDTELLDIEQMVNEGVHRAYLLPDNKLRASIVADPAGKRTNTKDNTPAVVHVSLVAGDKVEVSIAAKGGGSENKAKLAGILTYHVVPGRVYSEAAVAAKAAKTVQGASVAIKANDKGAFVNDAMIVATDVDASNGVIHIIDSVIMPPAK